MKRFLSLSLTAFLVSSLAQGAPGASFSGGAPSFGTTHEGKREAFEHVAKDGAAGWQVKFEVPAGRNGAAPSVALTYSSRAPLRGGIAAGWSLPISRIAVDTSRGRAQGLEYSIDGARLVRVADTSVAAGVEAFRAESDETFARYEHVADGSEEGRWIVRHLDGSSAYYGSTTASRDSRWNDSLAGDRTLGGQGRWFLHATVDAAGNRVSYVWASVIGSTRAGGLGVVDRNLVAIEYGANESAAGSAPHARVEFTWNAPEYCASSRVPIGAQSTYRNGLRTYEGAQKLTTIRSFVRTSPGSAWVKRRELTLNYDSAAASCTQLHGPLRMLTSVQESVTSPDGLVTTLPAQTFEYGPLVPDFTGVAPVDATVALPRGLNPFNPNKAGGWPALGALPVDLDGDGRLEELTSCNGLPRMPWTNEPVGPNTSENLNFREGCSPTAQVTHRSIPRGEYDCQGVGTTFFGYRFFDMTGDGLPDLVAAMNYQKGDYVAEDDALLTQLYPQAYPACSAMPAAPCQWGSTREACWLNRQTQFIAKPGGSAPSFAPDDGEGLDGGNTNQCPGNSCVQFSGCTGTADECCNPSYCAQDGHGPASDPPSVVEGNHFSGPGQSPVESQARQQSGSESCAFVADMHCGSYVWWVYPNKGSLTQGSWFQSQPRIVFSPVPLESDNMTTGSGSSSLANASKYRAAGDLDGDGLPDAIYQMPEYVGATADYPSDLHVWFGTVDGGFTRPNNNLGVSWQTPVFGTARAHLEESVSNLNPIATRTTKSAFLGDLNGDGLIDLVRGTDVYLNTGTGFEANPTPLAVGSAFTGLTTTEHRAVVTPTTTPFDQGFNVTTTRLIDLDLDGLEDLVVMSPPNSFNPFVQPAGATLRAFFNTGDGFTEASASEAARLLPWRQSLQAISMEHDQSWAQRTDVMDVNGDGLPDLVTNSEFGGCPTGPLPLGQQWSMINCGLVTQVQYAPATPLRALRAVNFGTGARAEFSYASTNDPQVVTRPAGSRLTSPLWVVKTMTLSSGTVGEAPQVTDFRYENPISNRDAFDRFGFRGFARTITTGPTPGTGRRLRTIKDWRFDLDPNGLLARTLEGEVWTLSDGHEELVRMTELEWRSLHLFPSELVNAPPALTNFAVNETRRTTCLTPLTGMISSVSACAAGAFFTRELSTWSPLYGPPSSRAHSPTIAYAVSAERRTASASSSAQPDDRLTSSTTQLRATPAELRLLRTSEQITTGTGTVLARQESDYETGPRAAVTESRRFIDATTIARTRFTYDVYGNVWKVMRPNQVARLLLGQSAAFIWYGYDAFGVFRANETNELGHLTRRTTDLATGLVTLEEGITQGTLTPRTRTKIDGFGRPLEVRRTVQSGNALVETLVGRFTYTDLAPRSVLEETLKSGATWIPTTSRLDGLGRITRTEQPAGGATQVAYRQFDGAGNAVAVYRSSPRGNSEALSWTQFDAFGRVTRVKHDDSAQLITAYVGNFIYTYEWPADGGPMLYRYTDSDAFGRVKTVAEGLQTQTPTRYVYDPLDRVKQVTDADGVISTLTFDWAGRRTVVERAGNRVEARFDLHGNRTTALFPTQSRVVDPVKYAAYWSYDALDRVIAITPMPRDLSPTLQSQLDWSPSGTSASYVLTWDTGTNAKGRLGKVKAPWGETTYGYTIEGWLANEGRSIAVRPDGVNQFTHSATQTMTYDLLGNVASITYPDGFATTATFPTDARGRPEAAVLMGVTPLEVARLVRNAAGVVTLRTTPTAGSSQTWSYDSMGRVASTRVQGQWCDTACTAGTVAGEEFTFFETGHPRTMTDLAKGRTFDFLYNDHVELRDARSRSGDYVGTFTYSPTGKVLTANVSTTLPSSDVVNRATTSIYAPWSATDYADRGAVRALRRADGSNLATLTYDAAGNLTRKTDPLATLDFATDARDAVREVRDQTGKRELYWYDHEGKRVLVYRSAPEDGSGAHVVHRFGTTEIKIKGSTRTSTVDVGLGAHAVARVTGGNILAPELLFHGALGSLLAAQNVSGTVTARYGYGPWGETLYSEGNSKFDRRYEAKAFDAFSRLSYFGFRYYDATTMAWTQGDPLYRRFPDAAGTEPRRMSPYVYVLNDPMTLVDPDGLEGFEAALVTHSSGRSTISRGDNVVSIPASGDADVRFSGSVRVPLQHGSSRTQWVVGSLASPSSQIEVRARVHVRVPIVAGQLVTQPLRVNYEVRFEMTTIIPNVVVDLGRNYMKTSGPIFTKNPDGSTSISFGFFPHSAQVTSAKYSAEADLGPAKFGAESESRTIVLEGSSNTPLEGRVAPVDEKEWLAEQERQSKALRDVIKKGIDIILPGVRK
jgi:RHS repeat-associated protein